MIVRGTKQAKGFVSFRPKKDEMCFREIKESSLTFSQANTFYSSLFICTLTAFKFYVT